LAISLKTHYKIISLLKIKYIFIFILFLKPFVDVDGPFLRSQNHGNSPHKKTFGYIINIYFKFFKKIGQCL